MFLYQDIRRKRKQLALLAGQLAGRGRKGGVFLRSPEVVVLLRGRRRQLLSATLMETSEDVEIRLQSAAGTR